MAKAKALTQEMKDMTSKLDQHKDQLKASRDRKSAGKSMQPPPPPPPIDCSALLDLIQAAQRLYSEECPIA